MYTVGQWLLNCALRLPGDAKQRRRKVKVFFDLLDSTSEAKKLLWSYDDVSFFLFFFCPTLTLFRVEILVLVRNSQ